MKSSGFASRLFVAVAVLLLTLLIATGRSGLLQQSFSEGATLVADMRASNPPDTTTGCSASCEETLLG